jgi:hypothetical protein
MKPKTGTRALALAAGLATMIGALAATALPAGAQKLYESTRYESVNQPIANWVTYAPDGTPIGKDPNCPSFPGIYRSSKVWATAYGVDEPLHTDFRMQFHTTYNRSVAAAMLAFQNRGMSVSCSTLNSFSNNDANSVRAFTACLGAPYAARPNRWCALYANNPNDPAVDAQVDQRCPGSADAAGDFQPTSWHEWHNLPDRVGNEAQLYKIDVLAQFASWLKALGLSINMPVYLDDVTIVGGVSNFDQSSAQPSYGNAWYGYGRVLTPTASEILAAWYDSAAQRLGYDPYLHPVAAHRAVDNAIAAGLRPVGTGLLALTRAQLYAQVICTSSWGPRVANVVDPGGARSLAAIGQDLSGWVQRETGETLCQKVHEQPQFAAVASAACNNTVVGLFFAVVDNNNCMNRPTDGIANLLGVNLGCNRDIHLARLFSQMKAFLGG